MATVLPIGMKFSKVTCPPAMRPLVTILGPLVVFCYHTTKNIRNCQKSLSSCRETITLAARSPVASRTKPNPRENQTNVQSNLVKGRIAVQSCHSSRRPLPLGNLYPSHNGFLDAHVSASKTASRSIRPFLRSSPVCPTYRHTDRARYVRTTSVAIVAAWRSVNVVNLDHRG